MLAWSTSERSSASKPRAQPYTICDRASNRSWIMKGCSWSGVFPAATTQFDAALDLDLGATRRVQAALVRDGVHGLVLMGTVGEGNSLSAAEKRQVLEGAVDAS